jgi:hypothetical protein
METAAFHPGLKQTLQAGAYLLFATEDFPDSTLDSDSFVRPEARVLVGRFLGNEPNNHIKVQLYKPLFQATTKALLFPTGSRNILPVTDFPGRLLNELVRTNVDMVTSVLSIIGVAFVFHYQELCEADYIGTEGMHFVFYVRYSYSDTGPAGDESFVDIAKEDHQSFSCTTYPTSFGVLSTSRMIWRGLSELRQYISSVLLRKCNQNKFVKKSIRNRFHCDATWFFIINEFLSQGITATNETMAHHKVVNLPGFVYKKLKNSRMSERLTFCTEEHLHIFRKVFGLMSLYGRRDHPPPLSQKHGKRLAYNDLVNVVVCENTDFDQMVVLEYDHYCIKISVAYQQYNYKTGGPNHQPIGCPASHLKQAILFFASPTGDDDSNAVSLDSSSRHSSASSHSSVDEAEETTNGISVRICVGTRFNFNDCCYDVARITDTHVSCRVHLPRRLRGAVSEFPRNYPGLYAAVAEYST